MAPQSHCLCTKRSPAVCWHEPPSPSRRPSAMLDVGACVGARRPPHMRPLYCMHLSTRAYLDDLNDIQAVGIRGASMEEHLLALTRKGHGM